jgi:2,4-dienoyl-CoA reductase-like NADH-dependent reductase (Old Yellow Enzyme family)
MGTNLFEETEISGMEIRNRFVRSATFEGMGTFDGRPTQMLGDLYYDLAEGEVGLIITGLTHVDGYGNFPDIAGAPFPLALDRDRYINDWAEIIDGVHRRGAKMAMQLTHLGRQDIPQLREPIAPSPVPIANSNIIPREMTLDEIEGMVEKFSCSCRRAKEAGFDAVQLHGCHGYLISNFLSPYANIRSDKYGGNTENRSRFLIEILERAKELVGPEFPILIKMNCADFIDGGLQFEEAIEIAKIIVRARIDCIEISGGTYSDSPSRISATGINKPEDEAYFKSYAEAFKKQIDVPIILVGGNRSYEIMSSLIEEGITDFISMSRPFIREPRLIKRWKDGNLEKAECISCNKCRDNMSIHPLRCYEEMPMDGTDKS